MCALAGSIELLHITPYALTIFHHRHLVTRNALAGDIGDMFRVTEKRHGIVIGAQQCDLAIQMQEPLQRRAQSKGIIPRLTRQEMLRPWPQHTKRAT